MQNITVQKLVLALVTLAGFLAAPWICSELLGGNTLPFSLLLGIGFLLIFVFIFKDKCWLSIPFCLPMGGSINILPIHFTPFELSILLVLGYFFLQFIMTDRRSLRFGPPGIWIPLLIIAVILIYHWGRGGGIGLTMFGGDASGGRRFFTILSGILVFPVLLWFSSPEEKTLRMVPVMYVLGNLMEFLPWVASTLAPAVAPMIYRFYTTVNLDAYSEAAGVSEIAIARYGPLGFIGLGIQVALISYYPARLWVRPSHWFVPFLSMICLLAVIFSGFRSFLFNYCLVSFVALFFSIRWTSLLLLPLGVIVVAIMCLGQGSAFELPLSIQRTLSPLPGKWNSLATGSADSSNEFRETIQKIYRDEFMDKAGWFGDGFKYDQSFMLDRALSFSERWRMQGGEEQARGFIQVRDHHVGWVAAHHTMGTAGLIAFVFLCVDSLVLVFRSVAKVPLGKLSPPQVWSCALIVQIIISYFTVFGSPHLFLPQLCVLLGIALLSFQPPFSFHSPNFPAPWPASKGRTHD